MRLKKNTIAVTIALALSSTAHAADTDIFSFSGFGTVGVAHSSEHNADVAPEFPAERGVGATDNISARLDSRLALQMDARFSDSFSAVVQAVSESAVTDSYTPEIALAHVKYRFSPELTMRLGRITAPLYMLSEQQRIGFASPLARHPNEVYTFLMAMDGIEGNYTISAGDTVIGLQAFYGEIDAETVSVEKFRGISATIDHGASSFRVGHVRGDATFSSPTIDALFDTYLSLPIPGLNELVQDLDPRGMDGSFNSIGYNYDPGNWFLRTEVVQVDFTPSVIAKSRSGFLSAGARIGAWTPSFTFAHLDTSDMNAPGAADPIGLMNLAVAQNNNSRHSFAAALRWDAYENMAVKLQATHVKNHAGSIGRLSNLQPGFQPGGSYNLVSASVDFVF